MDQRIDQIEENDSLAPWLWRAVLALEVWARPHWGWGVLVASMLLPMLPAVSLRANRWLALGSFQTTLEVAGPLAVATVWLLWGWREPRRERFGWLALIWAMVIGVVLLSQLLVGWFPGPRAVWQALNSGEWAQLYFNGVAAWMRGFTRFALWREGVAAGGAAQDNLVFATFGCAILWVLGMLTAWLARAVRQGLAAALPSLWLLGMILLYSSNGRYLLVVGLALMLALHILLEQAVLTARWQRLHLDYSPGLMVDRMLAVASGGAIILTLAAVMPSLYFAPLVNRYYSLLAPVHMAMEATSERLFPELHGTSRLRGGSGSGMPNEFLLQGGPNLGSAVVMRVRTDEAATSSYQYPYEEMAPPPSHYMRGRTLTLYDGRAWRNPSELEREDVPANSRWGRSAEWGRKQVVQSVILEAASNVLYAAPEAVEVSVEARLERRSGVDLVTVQGREQSYTVVSMVPAVDEAMLRALPSWATNGESPVGPLLPEAMAIHLQLPESVTERTRTLAQELIAGRQSDFDKASAIEQYLRQYAYDLEVSEPPAEVTDVADYFLFDLQRGYCDYYATAFVVLARLAGLPTRFATGFATGQWDAVGGVFVINEGDAHSWPEVYFPDAGWVPFEPTAGRAELTRIALPQANAAVSPPPVVPTIPIAQNESAWNWQPLVWLVPLAGLLWLVVLGWQWWWRRREDPWQAILQWGNRAGRPMLEGETVLEYGQGLAGFVMLRQVSTADAGRIAAREIQAVSEEVNRVRYGREDERLRARQALEARWTRLRSYLPLVRLT